MWQNIQLFCTISSHFCFGTKKWRAKKNPRLLGVPRVSQVREADVRSSAMVLRLRMCDHPLSVAFYGRVKVRCGCAIIRADDCSSALVATNLGALRANMGAPGERKDEWLLIRCGCAIIRCERCASAPMPLVRGWLRYLIGCITKNFCPIR